MPLLADSTKKKNILQVRTQTTFYRRFEPFPFVLHAAGCQEDGNGGGGGAASGNGGR
jgi:hypothetical protein